MRRLLVPLFTLLLLCPGLFGLQRQCAAGDTQPPPREEPKVSQLIEELGSDSYATRVRAREMLQRMGLEAFDQLHQAQYHHDIEIANTARRLVSSLLVSWWKESDPPAVRAALDEYGAQNETERANRIELLGQLPGRLGLNALARLARFEPNLRLSEKAALVLMQQPLSDDPSVRLKQSEAILDSLGGVDRYAAQWLRLYARDLAEGSFSSKQWRELIDRQRELLNAKASQVVTYTSVLELVRVVASQAVVIGDEGEALALAVDNIDLIPPQRRELTDASSWALDNNLYAFVLELRRRHEERFNEQPVLLYGAAEALIRSGDADAAEQLAQRARSIKPLPESEEKRAELSPRELEELAELHRVIGHELQLRGLFRWAEQEYRQVIDALEIDTRPSPSTRVQLARMLGELQKHDAVVEVLSPLAERIKKDEKLAKRLGNLRFNYNAVHSDREYHRGLALIEAGRKQVAAPVLERALELSQPTNIDILIAMFHLDAGEEWNRRVRDILDRTVRICETDVRNAEIRQGQMGPLGFGTDELAHELNEYAWLVSNTEGDYRKALRFSKKSLELVPNDPALLDTCARCYFATGDVTNAIQMQRRALRQMPHSPPMQRQLDEFLQNATEASE